MTDEILTAATAARDAAPPVGAPAYDAFCAAVAGALRAHWPAVRKANADDVDAARAQGHPEALLDRIGLHDGHLERLCALAAQVRAALPGLSAPRADDPGATGPLHVRRIPKPLGVVLFVYEARPTVTVEGALLAAATGNAVLLRGGREIAATNAALRDALTGALRQAGLPAGLVHVLDDADRRQFRALLRRHDAIDLLIPRGSPSLIEHCLSASSIPVVASGGGVNHLYVHADADPVHAAAVALDSKLAEPTACNTLEMVLAHEDIAAALVAEIAAAAGRAGVSCTLRLGPGLHAAPAGPVAVQPLAPHDLGREFLDRTFAVLAVPDLDAALTHIRTHGSRHTEGIVAVDRAVIGRFCERVDAAAIVVDGSLRLHDGPTMGLGPELSISTGRLHVRGPVRLSSLLTYSWVIEGHGTLREGSRP